MIDARDNIDDFDCSPEEVARLEGQRCYWCGGDNRFCAMATFSNITLGDTTLQMINGCHDLRKYQ